MTIAFLSAKNTHKYFIYHSNFQNHWSINVSHLYCKYTFDGEKKSKSVSFVCILSNRWFVYMKYFVITYFSLSFWWHDNFCLTKQWHDTRMLTEMIWTFYTCNNFAIRFITAILKCRSKVVTRFLFHITSKDRNNFFKYLDKRIKTFSFLNLYGCFLRILHDGQNFSWAYSSFILLYMSSNMFYLVSIIHISSQKERNALVCFHIIFNIVWHMIPTQIRKVSF